jgi:DNA-binding CsgD family transcriptional regulator
MDEACALIFAHHQHVRTKSKGRGRDVWQRKRPIPVTGHWRKAAVNLAAVLDALAAAIYLMDAQGRVVHANRTASETLTTANAPFVAGGRLRTHDSAIDRRLGGLFAASVRSNRESAIKSRGVAIHVRSGRARDYVAHVLPISVTARRNIANSSRAVAVLLVRRAAEQESPPPGVLAKAFGLTTREVDVLLTIAETPGVADTAKRLGVSRATVRAHLRSLFAKTGRRRQAELVKLVSRFSSPLA